MHQIYFDVNLLAPLMISPIH